MKTRLVLILLLLGSLLLTGLSRKRLEAAMPWRFPPPNEMIVSTSYMSDLGALMLGARRLAADLVYVQFLQYYGTDEVEEEHHEQDGHDHDKDHEPGPPVHDHFGKGKYSLVKEFGMRVIRLDPFFNPVILEMAGALAFNLHRTDEALDLLKEGIARDPSFYRYRIYVGAILYKSSGQDKGLIRLLKEAIRYPDCPAMLQNILGNLLIKYGDFKEAARVYVHMYKSSANEADQNDALKRLKTLITEHPSLAGLVDKELSLPGN